jgi:hypothetical protein
MTSIRVKCVLAAMAVIAAPGCGWDDASEADKSSQPADSSRTLAPSQAFGPTYAEGVIEKKIGEPAGLNCSDPKPAEVLRVSWLELKWEWPIPGSD